MIDYFFFNYSRHIAVGAILLFVITMGRIIYSNHKRGVRPTWTKGFD